MLFFFQFILLFWTEFMMHYKYNLKLIIFQKTNFEIEINENWYEWTCTNYDFNVEILQQVPLFECIRGAVFGRANNQRSLEYAIQFE